jgi:WD40 repeat protein
MFLIRGVYMMRKLFFLFLVFESVIVFCQAQPGHSDFISSVRFSADGKSVITEAFDSTIRVWDAATGAEVARIPIDIKLRVMHAEFSPDQSRIITYPIKGKPVIWNAATGKQVTALRKTAKHINSVAFSFDNTKVVLVDDENTAAIYNAVTGKRMRKLSEPKFTANFTRFSPDGRLVYTVTYDQEDHLYYYTTWSAKKGKHKAAFTFNFSKSSNFPDSLPFSKDGKRFIVYYNTVTPLIRDARTGREKGKLEGYNFGVKSAIYACDDKYIITTTDDNACEVWSNDAKGNIKMLYVIKGINFNSFHISNTAQVSADRKSVITIHDKNIQVRNIATSVLMNDLSGHTAKITSFELGPVDPATGKQLLLTASDDRTAKIWDLQTGKMLFSLEGHEHALRDACFSPDGSRVATIEGNMVRIWEVGTGRMGWGR